MPAKLFYQWALNWSLFSLHLSPWSSAGFSSIFSIFSCLFVSISGWFPPLTVAPLLTPSLKAQLSIFVFRVYSSSSSGGGGGSSGYDCVVCSNQQQPTPSSSVVSCAYVQCLKTESFCGSQCYSGPKVSNLVLSGHHQKITYVNKKKGKGRGKGGENRTTE